MGVAADKGTAAVGADGTVDDSSDVAAADDNDQDKARLTMTSEE